MYMSTYTHNIYDYICIWVPIYISDIYAYIYVYMHDISNICSYLYIWVPMHNIYGYAYIYVYIRLYLIHAAIYVYVFMYIYIYIYVYVFMYMVAMYNIWPYNTYGSTYMAIYNTRETAAYGGGKREEEEDSLGRPTEGGRIRRPWRRSKRKLWF